MTKDVNTFLMFQGRCEQALNLYVSLIPGSKIASLAHYPPGSPGEGKVMAAELVLGDKRYRCNDSPIRHDFTFTPSISFFVDCESEAELDRLYAALAADGKVLMEPMDHGFSRKFAWVQDRFDVSWQLNLPF